jgi:endonuclease-8
MPEGDTVFRTAATLREALVGTTLTRCDIRVPRYATVDLSGRVVDEVLSQGKHLFIRVGDASIHSHLKMDGSWRVTRGGRPARADHRSGSSWRPATSGPPSRSGRARGARPRTTRTRSPTSGRIYSATTGIRTARRRTWPPTRPARSPRRCWISGCWRVGNVYCNELCFVFGQLPTSAVSTLPDRSVTAREMLWVNRLRTNRTTTGNRRPGEELWVYGQAGRPCRRCGTPIRRAESSDATGERVTYWCPSCQR